jgi:preprotein translocase subunit SecE
VARNRKRAKERRARRPAPVATQRSAGEPEAPDPIEHAAPDVELAEAQLAVGRPDVGDQSEDTEDIDAKVTEEDLAEPQDELPGPAHDEDEFAEEDNGELTEQARLAQLRRAAGTPGSAAGLPAFGAGVPDSDPADTRGVTVGDTSIAPARARPGPRLVTFLQGSWAELQRVQWPDRRQTLQATGVVIGFVIVAGVFLGVADALAVKLVNYIIGR